MAGSFDLNFLMNSASFLLTSSFVVQPGIKVKLPKAASGQQDDSDKIFLTVTKSEQIYLNSKSINRRDLGTQLRRLLQEKEDKLVVIRADKDLSLEATIRIVVNFLVIFAPFTFAYKFPTYRLNFSGRVNLGIWNSLANRSF